VGNTLECDADVVNSVMSKGLIGATKRVVVVTLHGLHRNECRRPPYLVRRTEAEEMLMVRGWIAGMAIVALVGCGDETTSAGTAASTSGSGGSSASTAGAGGAGSGGETGAGGAGEGGSGMGGSGGSAAVWGPEKCPAPSTGVSVGFDEGQQLADIVVKDCNDNDVSLEQFCGADALFIFAAHGWCPLCKSVSSQEEAIHDSFAGKNLASVNIVVETGMGGVPDAEYCKLWRNQNGQEDVATLYDPTGKVLALWPGGSSSLSAYVDQNRVITGKLVHNSDVAMIKAQIQGALDK
jgi:hypothetical protein